MSLSLKTVAVHHCLVFCCASLSLAHTQAPPPPSCCCLTALVPYYSSHLSFLPPVMRTATFIPHAPCLAFSAWSLQAMPSLSSPHYFICTFGTPHERHFLRTVFPDHPPQNSSLFYKFLQPSSNFLGHIITVCKPVSRASIPLCPG